MSNSKTNSKKTIFRQNKRIKYDAKKYLKKVINKNGEAVLPIKLNNKEEMFNKHDPRGLTLSEDIINYIEEVAYDVPYDNDIVFEISCPNLSRIDKEKMTDVIKLYYGLEIAGIDEDLKITKRKSTTMWIIAIISILLMFASYKWMDSSFMELLLIAVWFSVWEAIDEMIYTQSDLNYNRMDAEQIYSCKVIFSEDE